MTDKTDLISILKEKRPNLSDSTLYSYVSSLRGLHKRVFGDLDIDIDNFNKVDKIMEDLEKKPATSRKTVLAILYVLTDIPEYQNQMKQDIKAYKEETNKQEMSEKQKENYMTQQQILAKFKELEKQAKELYKKSELSIKDKDQIQNYIILALTSGIYFPPRRALDLTEFKIANITDDSNYLEKNKFVFNLYKGSKKKGQQKIDVPKPLLTILNKWISINNNDYLLHDIQGNKLNSVKLNQRLHKIFNGKKSAINVLRHSFLSEKFQDTINVAKELNNTMKEMGSSSDQSKIYINKL